MTLRVDGEPLPVQRELARCVRSQRLNGAPDACSYRARFQTTTALTPPADG